MKQNGHDIALKPYYIGLDVGTNSIGWAATGHDYALLKAHGNSLWGVHLFEEAQDASARRTARTARRRLERKKQRLALLEMLFAEEIHKIDPGFFTRLHESDLYQEDKTDSTNKYSLFCSAGYTDKEYLKAYPTIYHLRSRLINDTAPADVRLVFLALHHLMKKRGHFLYAGSDDSAGKTLPSALNDLNACTTDIFEQEFAPADFSKYCETLQQSLSITEKKKCLRGCYGSVEQPDFSALDTAALSDLLSGAKVKLSDLFCDDSLKKADISSVSLKEDIDAKFDDLSDILGERVELILSAKTVYDIAHLDQILGGNRYLCEAKVALYQKNKRDLRLLKDYVRAYHPSKYKEIFVLHKKGLNNYAAYSRYRYESDTYTCNQEQFCKYIADTVFKKVSDLPEKYACIAAEVSEKTFLTKLSGPENGVVPYQLNLQEVKAILANAEAYLPFLSQKDADGKTVSEKIISIFEFRIPYYVGPLNKKSPNSWVVRTDEKVYPWNFEQVVNTEDSAVGFMVNLIGRCTYTGEPVLPKDSLLYSEFMVLNEINNLRINGKALPVEVKTKLVQDLFVVGRKKVTKKRIRDYLAAQGCLHAEDELSGVDDTIKSNLRSLHDFEELLHRTGNTALVEDIIEHLLIFGEDKRMLRRWLQKNCKELTQADIKHICRLKYSDWGRLSKTFLSEIYSTPDENGEVKNIIEQLRDTSLNLMQLLNSGAGYAQKADAMLKEKTGADASLKERLNDMYLAPAVRRSILRTLRVVDEVVDSRKGAPEKIFIEVARGSAAEMKGKRTESRKAKLQALYKACGTLAHDWDRQVAARLEQETDATLRRDKLYLYYTQFGRCMYTGEPIDLEACLQDNLTYDIDHIYPRSRIKDDSLDNRVLVKSIENREKTNAYPIKENIRRAMLPFWTELRKKDLISQKKFDRLVRNYALTDAELSEFVARQLTITQQSTKALAHLLEERYPNTRIVYSKAGNVSEFRQDFNLPKNREVNDLHHAKDAYLNIVVGNVYDTRFTKQFFQNISRETYSLKRVFDYNVAGAWQATGNVSIGAVKATMAKNNVLYTRMPHEARGKLFDLQIKPKGQGQIPIKTGKLIDKYGGYKNPYGAYMFVVEHTAKKKRVRTIEAVLLCDRVRFEADPLAYCTNELHLVDPRIIVSKLRFDALLEIDGSRVNISGRTNDSYFYKHAWQLAIDEKTADYIKRLSKYVDRCAAAKAELPITPYDGITAEENVALYEWFLKKLDAKVYQQLFQALIKDLTAEKEHFSTLGILDQSKVLREILKAFKCDRQLLSLELLNGKKSVGNIKISKDLSSRKSVKLIHQSITGIYEIKQDLLK